MIPVQNDAVWAETEEVLDMGADVICFICKPKLPEKGN